MKLLGTTSAILMASTMLTHAAVFTNGDFELPDLGSSAVELVGGDQQPANFITGWTAATSGTGGSTIYLASIPFAFLPGTTSGDQVVGFNNDTVGGTNSLAQQFDTISGQAYSITFDLAREVTADPELLLPSLNVVTDAAGSVTANYFATNAFTSYSYAFTASSTSTTLTFSRVAAANQTRSPILDTVAVTAVPEPTSLGLLGLGALGLIARRRR